MLWQKSVAGIALIWFLSSVCALVCTVLAETAESRGTESTLITFLFSVYQGMILERVGLYESRVADSTIMSLSGVYVLVLLVIASCCKRFTTDTTDNLSLYCVSGYVT